MGALRRANLRTRPAYNHGALAFRRLALGSALALTCSVHLVMHAAGREALSLDLLLTRPVSPGSITDYTFE